MTIELYSLTVLTIFFLLAWLPASIAKRQAYGRSYLLSNRDARDLPELPPWGDRANRAYENLKCYYPAFAIAVLVLAHLGRSDLSTQIAAVVFTSSRLLHFFFYSIGNVPARAWSWGFGVLSALFLLVRIVAFGAA